MKTNCETNSNFCYNTDNPRTIADDIIDDVVNSQQMALTTTEFARDNKVLS